jgi:hypothetical protein
LQPNQRLDVKANATRAMLRDTNGQRHQFFVLGADRALGHGRLRQLTEALHRLRLRLAQRGYVVVDVFDQGGVLKRAHGVFLRSRYRQCTDYWRPVS